LGKKVILILLNPENIVRFLSQYVQNNIVAPKGTLYIQHGNLIHGSYGNMTNHTTRGMFSATYIAEGEKFIKGNEAFRQKIKL
jgi:hypothetical protein